VTDGKIIKSLLRRVDVGSLEEPGSLLQLGKQQDTNINK
jgi:hypothetical protein